MGFPIVNTPFARSFVATFYLHFISNCGILLHPRMAGNYPRTVLQHARMYGYRRKDIGLLRLFLPPQLHTVFKAINRMEQGLRDLIQKKPAEDFRGIYVESGLNPTRKNVLAPGTVGVYSAGSNYNPAQVLRDESVVEFTKKIDNKLESVGNKDFIQLPIQEIRNLIELTKPDF